MARKEVPRRPPGGTNRALIYRTLVAWSKAPIQPAAHSELCWSQCLEYARPARTTARAAPARNRRSFRCKGSADIVPHTELAGTTE